jgi:hypothetical protein
MYVGGQTLQCDFSTHVFAYFIGKKNKTIFIYVFILSEIMVKNYENYRYLYRRNIREKIGGVGGVSAECR